jgi:hypothetical protein
MAHHRDILIWLPVSSKRRLLFLPSGLSSHILPPRASLAEQGGRQGDMPLAHNLHVGGYRPHGSTGVLLSFTRFNSTRCFKYHLHLAKDDRMSW